MRHLHLGFVVVLGLVSIVANAANWDWKKVSYAHYSENEPVEALLQQFASSVDVGVVISDDVTGVVNGNFEEAPALDFLNRLSKTHNLHWYYDGHLLYVYDITEVKTELIHLQGVTVKRLTNSLRNLSILDNRFALQSVSSEGIVKVSGPPRYTELVAEVAQMLMAGAQPLPQPAKPDDYVVRVFQLKHAWADDREMVIRGRTVTVAGVASSLQALLSAHTDIANVQSENSAALPGLKGQGLASEQQEKTDIQQQQEDMRSSSRQAGRSQVVANERLNAVIVHDLQSKMPIYQGLIASLDQPNQQIEIEVSIIDVSTERLNEVGIEWQANSGNFGLTNADLSAGAAPAEINDLALSFGNGIGFSAVQTNAENLFLSRIRVLVDEGDASVLSQPTILTLDNMEALLDHSTTFHIRLAGENEVDLYPISVGSVLRVTPHIVAAEAENKIHLKINIEDGQQTGQLVDNIPAVSKSVINTEAFVNESESLLIGGHYFDQESRSVRKVPLLGSIPILGHLFRKNTTTVQQRARLFLISPRIVASSTPQDDYQKTLDLLTDTQRNVLKVK